MENVLGCHQFIGEKIQAPQAPHPWPVWMGLSVDSAASAGSGIQSFGAMKTLNHWIGLRENLQETMILPSNIRLSCKFSHHPILWLKFLDRSGYEKLDVDGADKKPNFPQEKKEMIYIYMIYLSNQIQVWVRVGQILGPFVVVAPRVCQFPCAKSYWI